MDSSECSHDGEYGFITGFADGSERCGGCGIQTKPPVNIVDLLRRVEALEQQIRELNPGLPRAEDNA